jgi:phage-related protein
MDLFLSMYLVGEVSDMVDADCVRTSTDFHWTDVRNFLVGATKTQPTKQIVQ